MTLPVLILASGSPRRRQLLDTLGVAHEVVAAEVRELDGIGAPRLTPEELARENARLKAGAVARRRPGRWVLGADTVVALEGRLFGKPADLEEARAFLRRLRGRTHRVITGCALVGPDGGIELFHDATEVTFLPFSEATLERYLAEVHVLDKAGAYALQERGDWLVKRTHGSASNVVGLPVEALERVLRARGLLP